MPNINITDAVEWAQSHLAVTITAATALTILILSVTAAQVWASYRGRSLTARASAFFAVVQAGVAFVTITGVYEFWADVVDVNGVEAAGIAVFIEAVTWAAVADIFVHGSDPATVGLGRSGPLFWSAIVGGGIMAIIGSGDVGTAIGRTVVVALGAMMWHVRIRQRTRQRTGQGRWANPFKTFALRQGWMIADDGDVTQTSREWQVRTLTRAMYRKGRAGKLHGLSRWTGERTIRRVMEAGDTAMVRDAQRRYALQEVLRTEITPTSTSMAAAITAAREALNPPPAPEPPPAPDPVPDVTAPEPPPARPRPPRRTASDGPTPRRTAGAAAAKQDPAAAEALRERAVVEAMDALTRDGKTPSAADWGKRYDMGEEWGRQRLIAARKRLDAVPAAEPASDVPALNGSPVA